MIGHADLNRRISVERAVATYNALNEPVKTWAVLIDLWAKRTDVSDGEKLAAGQVGSFVVTRFIVRHEPAQRAGILPSDRIRHEGRIWSVHGIKEKAEGLRRWIEITAAASTDTAPELAGSGS